MDEVHRFLLEELDIRGALVQLGPSWTAMNAQRKYAPPVRKLLGEMAAVTALSPDEQAAVRSRRIGFVFQSFHLVPRLTAAENVALPMILAGIPPAQRAERVAQTLRDYGLENRADHRPDQLSGGQRQRVAIARATIMQPAVILADEPTGNLDRATGEEVMRLLETLNGQGVTLIVVTHDGALGARARRQLLMEDGALQHDSARPEADTSTCALPT